MYVLVLLAVLPVMPGWSNGATSNGMRDYLNLGRIEASTLNRDDFPFNFVFGSGTSAYQVEGAANEDGRSPSVWDTSAHAGYVQGTGDVTSDGYHKYKEDVKLMKEVGLEAYRFSISWSRIIPNGRGEVNPKGVAYYNNLISELLHHGIQPHVSLFHYDLPQVLEDEYGGWLSSKIIEDFTAYADVCFREFGDRIVYWTTLNEPNIVSSGSYDVGITPPNRCSAPFGNCTVGNSVIEPYVAAHHLLLAHASAAHLYRVKYQESQKGLIGINLFMYNLEPYTNSTQDITAVKRAQEFFVGWFMEPLTNGDYPATMRSIAGRKMPVFKDYQREQLIGSFDFIGLNYYATLYVRDNPHDMVPSDQRDYLSDMAAKLSGGSHESLTQLKKTAAGLLGVLEYFKLNYGNPPIYVHENGYLMQQNVTFNDSPRVKFMIHQFECLQSALRDGSNVVGYLSWSFIDVVELLTGYQSTYGLFYVDFADKSRSRYPRLSAFWYSSFLGGSLGKHAADASQHQLHST